MRKFAYAAVLTLVAVTFAVAEELQVRIYKCNPDQGWIMYKKTTTGEKKRRPDRPEEGNGTVVYVAKDAKILNVVRNKDPKFNQDAKKFEDPVAIDGGLNAFSNLPRRTGVAAAITIADDGADKGKVTKIVAIGLRMERRKK